MSLLTKKSIYGLIAIYELYKKKNGSNLMQLRDISNTTGIPRNYLEQIFIELKKANLIVSIRGAKGGYKITNNANEINIKEIITALDGEICTIKGETTNLVFNLFFNDCDKKLVDIFDKPLSVLEEYELMLSRQINYVI